MYKLNRLRETFLIIAVTQDEIETGVTKIRASYPYPQYYHITTFKQSDTETIVQVWEIYRLND